MTANQIQASYLRKSREHVRFGEIQESLDTLACLATWCARYSATWIAPVSLFPEDKPLCAK